jgi:hypothetical protein
MADMHPGRHTEAPTGVIWRVEAMRWKGGWRLPEEKTPRAGGSFESRRPEAANGGGCVFLPMTW